MCPLEFRGEVNHEWLLLPRPPLFAILVSTSTRISAWLHIPRQCRMAFCDEAIIRPPICFKGGLLSLVRCNVRPTSLLSRVDYGNATLAGLPARQLCRLQSVLHAAARIVFSARKYDHVTPLLRELHRLGVPERITFKLAFLVFRCLNGTAPVYIADSINRAADVMSARGGVCVPARQRLWLFQWLVAARSGIALSRSPLPARGTVYCRLSHHRSSSLSTFKRHLKTYLFATWYWWRCWPSCFFLCLPNMSSFLCVTCPCSFWTKRHANLLVNNNEDNRDPVMELSSSDDRMIVAWVILTQCQRVTDGRTDGRIYYS